MADNPIRFLKFDFESHRDAIKQRISDRWPTRWNDFHTSSFGIILTDVIAWSTALLAYSINAIAGENYIPTMRLRESATRIGALTGYVLHGPSASTLQANAALTAPLTYPITIRAGSAVRAQNLGQTVFEVTTNYTIPAGSLSPERLVATFNASLDGDADTDVRTNVRVVAGASYVDLVDTSIDVSQKVSIGQELYGGDGLRYTITGFTAAPSAISFNRILIDPVWAGSAGVTQVTVVDTRIELTQGQTITETVVTPSDDTTFRWIFPINRASLVRDSIRVTVAGSVWSEVTSLATQDSDATVFTVNYEVNGNTTVRFGDDTFGARIPSEALVAISYRIGGGSAGNVSPGQLRSSVVGYASSPNSSVSVAVTNDYTSATGGLDAETLEEARVNIPLHTQTCGTCVTLSDYETTARKYSGIVAAKATARRTASLLEGNVVTLYAWTSGSGGALVACPDAVKTGLRDYLQSKSVATDFVVIADGVSRPMPVAVRFTALSATDAVDVRLRLEDVSANYARGLSVGEAVVYSDLLRLMDETPEVDSVLLAVPSGDLRPRSDNEIFSTPLIDYFYRIQMTGLPNAAYYGVFPYYPLSVWALKVRINGAPAAVVPDTEEGYARITASALSTAYEGRSEDRPAAGAGYANAYYQTTDTGEVFRCTAAGASYGWALQTATQVKSRISIRDGSVTLHTTGVLNSVDVSLIPVQGCTSIRFFDVYVAYSATSGEKLTTRTRIRDAIVSAVDQLVPSGSVFSERTTASASAFNLKNVVEHVDGVAECTRVALDSATATGARIDANDYQQLRVRKIIINGFVN